MPEPAPVQVPRPRTSGRSRPAALATVADQAFTSLSNLVASLLALRVLQLGEFGAFSVGFATYLVALGVGRAVVGDPLLVRHSHDRAGTADVAGRAAAAATLLGAALSCLLLVVAVVLRHDVGVTLLVLAAVLPALLLQDALRYIAFAQGRPQVAAASDLAWLVLEVALLAPLLLLERPSLPLVTAAWALPGVLACGPAMWALGLRLRYRGSWAWVRSNLALSRTYLAEYATVAGLQQGTVYLVAAVAGLPAAATLRAAQVALGPMNVVLTGLALSGLPQAVRCWRTAPLDLPSFCRRYAATLLGVVVVLGGSLLLLPPALGTALLGPTWHQARDLLPFLVLAAAGNAVSTGASTGLKAMQRSSDSLALRLVLAPLTLASIAALTVPFGARGAAVGLGVVAVSSAPAWWSRFRGSRARGLDAALLTAARPAGPPPLAPSARSPVRTSAAPAVDSTSE